MKKISKRSILLWRIRLMLAAVPILMSASFCRIVQMLLAAVISVIFFIYLPLKYKEYFYKTDNGSLQIKKGVVYRSEMKIPRERIQYVSFFATPVERLLGLKTAVVYTAGRAVLIGSLEKHDDI